MKAAKYLMKALQSVDDQTFKNTEVVIVDDNSNDDPFSVINMFKENSSETDFNILQNKYIRCVRSKIYTI